MTEIVLFPQCLNPIWIMKPSKEKQIYYGKYIFYMLASIIITTTTNATE